MRHAAVQLLDDYTSVLGQRGRDAAQAMWADRPRPSGDRRVDAAFAALGEHLARRDGWPAPEYLRVNATHGSGRGDVVAFLPEFTTRTAKPRASAISALGVLSIAAKTWSRPAEPRMAGPRALPLRSTCALWSTGRWVTRRRAA